MSAGEKRNSAGAGSGGAFGAADPGGQECGKIDCLVAACLDAAEYLEEVLTDMEDPCDPGSGDWCSKFCESHGCAQMRIDHLRVAMGIAKASAPAGSGLQVSADTGWRPIASAPKDRLIDIWIKRDDGSGVRWTDCYYDSICSQWRTSRPGGLLVSVPERAVTHWREPPARPEGVNHSIKSE